MKRQKSADNEGLIPSHEPEYSLHRRVIFNCLYKFIDSLTSLEVPPHAEQTAEEAVLTQARVPLQPLSPSSLPRVAGVWSPDPFTIPTLKGLGVGVVVTHEAS